MFIHSSSVGGPRRISTHESSRNSSTVDGRARARRKAPDYEGYKRNLALKKSSSSSTCPTTEIASLEEKNGNEIDQIESTTRKESSIIGTKIQFETRIKFRVRGEIFETFESTLDVFPDTLLGNKLTRDKYYNIRTNEYEIDRCCYSFSAILFYYQSHGILSRPADIDRDLFLGEVEFYMIDEYIDARHRQEVEYLEMESRKNILPPTKFRKVLWIALEFRDNSPITNCFFYVYLVTSLIGLFTFCSETISSIGTHKLWQPLETSVCLSFSLEYVLRLYASPNTLQFMISASGIIDFLSIVPYFTNLFLNSIGATKMGSLSAFTLVRVMRVFKLTRFHDGLRVLIMTIYESLFHLLSLLLSISITSLLFAALMYHIEHDVTDIHNQFYSIPASFWYTIITATGVGYGDIFPETPLGKLVGAILSIVGVLLFCLPTPVLVNKFVECYYLHETVNSIKTGRRRSVVIRMRKTFLDDSSY